MSSVATSSFAARQAVKTYLEAASSGNLDLFKKLAMQLDGGKGIAGTVADAKDGNKRTALHFAARSGRIEVCRYLLEELKLEADVRDFDGDTPLIHAARQRHLSMVKYLLEQGADPAASSLRGVTALHHAAGIGNIEMLNLLLSKGVDVDAQRDAGTPLVWAAGHGQLDAVKVLLEQHANPNAETDDGITPLLSAVSAGSVSCLELLIQAGGNPNVTGSGASPLLIAADIGSIPIINLLLKAGGDPNIGDEVDGKPIQVAAARNHREVVELLFPSTSPLPNISNWSVKGLFEYMQSKARTRLESYKPEESEVPEASMQKLKIVERFDEAANAFYEGVQLAPDNKELVDAFRDAVEAGKKLHGTDKPKQ